MRVLDALSALKMFGKRQAKQNDLITVWSENAAKNETIREYPRPQMRRREWTCLNGLWHYAFTKNGNRPEEFEGRILVPFSPECSRSGVEQTLVPGDYLWYFRSLELPEKYSGKRLILHFGAVDERCVVWWNGKVVGSHRNGYLPFSFDVTDYAQEGKNTIWVRVQDDTGKNDECKGKQHLHPSGMFYPAQSGIWQTVWMEWVPENHIEKLKLTPIFDESKIRIEIMMAKAKRMRIQISGEGTNLQHVVRARDFQINRMPGKNEGKALLDVVLEIPELHPWSPDDPYLYEVQLDTGEDTVMSYFAMRKFSVGKDTAGHPRLMLNNEPFFFQGVLDQGYWPESLYTAPSDEAMIFDIQKMKDLGFNMIRKHVKIEPLRWYYHCDRLGIVVWQDMVNGGRINMPFQCYLPSITPSIMNRVSDSRYRLFGRKNQEGREQWLEDCLETVKLLYNSPSIGMWIPFNESWGQFDALFVTQRIRQLDSTRLIDHASGWYDQGGGDVKSVHNYFRKLTIQHSRRPFVISEYGGFSCLVPEHSIPQISYGYRTMKNIGEYEAAYKKIQKRIQRLAKKGLSGAVFTQVSDVEGECNGLLTYDRKIAKV